MRGGRVVSIRQSNDSRMSAPLDLYWFEIPQLGSGECDTACAELELRGKIVGGEMRSTKFDLD